MGQFTVNIDQSQGRHSFDLNSNMVLNKVLVILTYLMWHFFIECLKSVSQSIGLKLLIQEHLLELADHSIEDGSCDLYKLKGVIVRRDGDYKDVSRK